MLTNPTVEPASATSVSLAILVADDADDIQQTLRQWLEANGHQVFCASTGFEAVRLIQQQRVDLVITEVILPNGDGLELITALKKAQPMARVIAHSGGGRYLTGPECLRVAKGLGAHETLLKPSTRDELLAVIARAMEGAQRLGGDKPSALFGRPTP